MVSISEVMASAAQGRLANPGRISIRQLFDVDTDDDEDESSAVLATTTVFWVLALFTVALRLYSRTRLSKFRGQDDWWMLAALVFSSLNQAFNIILSLHGLGKPLGTVGLEDIRIFAYIGFAFSVNYPISLGLVKISILTFYLRLFPHNTFRKMCYVMIAVVVGVTISSSFGQLFACTPFRAAYALDVTTKSCINRPALQYSGSVMNLVTDLIVLLMPLKYLWNISLEKGKRIGIIAIFSMGLMTCVASAVRLSTIHAFYTGVDFTLDAYPIIIWSGVEVNLTIITASVPAIKTFVTRYIRSPWRRRFSSKSTPDTSAVEKPDTTSSEAPPVAHAGLSTGGVSESAHHNPPRAAWWEEYEDDDDDDDDDDDFAMAEDVRPKGRELLSFADMLKRDNEEHLRSQDKAKLILVESAAAISGSEPPSKGPADMV